MDSYEYRQSRKTAAQIQAEIDLMRLAYRPPLNRRRPSLLATLLPPAAAIATLIAIIAIIFSH